MRCALVLSLLLLVAGPVRAEETPTVASVTEPGRSFDRAFDVVLATPPSSDQGDRHVVLVLDAGPALRTAGFASSFRAAVARNMRHLAQTRFTLLTTAKGARPLLKRVTAGAKLTRAVQEALAKPHAGFANVYAAVRKGASAAGSGGDRTVLLVSLDNADLEDDIEGTARALKKKGVTFHAITRESFLSDTYWRNYGYGKKTPRPSTFAMGGDAAFLQVPWGWLFQNSIVHSAAASGAGPYGLCRVAARTGGRVFLYAPPDAKHSCAAYGSCLFCMGDDHLPPTQSYQAHRVRAVAARAASRKQVLKAMAGDPCYRLVLSTWAKAAKLGLLRSKPSVKPAGGTLKPESRDTTSHAPLLSGLNLKRNAQKARALAKEARALAKAHAAALSKISTGSGSQRARAIAEYTLAMLRLTAFNIDAFVAWCEGPGPWHVGNARRELLAPEIPPHTSNQPVVGIHAQTWSLCHGVTPFRFVRIGVSEEALVQLEAELEPYFRRWAHSPFEIALRQAGIARFYVTVRGKGTTPTTKRSGSDSDADTTDSAPRPARGGGGGSSSGGGATTGGG